MKKPNKAALAKHLKGYVNVTKSPVDTKLVIDGRWLLYQCSYVSGETYVNIARKFFDGYKPWRNDHDHKRRKKSLSSNIVLNQNTSCTITKARFLANRHNLGPDDTSYYLML